MEVEFFADEISEDENVGLDCNSEDYLDFEGERCGICMDIVVDQGVLDCCQHWFCFTCIDNWSSITSLCPICQNEFQLITCVPVYDTVGGSQTDEESNLSDDDWFIEGKNSALSFPSYYIDENAVLCMGEDGCKIRSGSVEIEGESDIDTSIACDSCDKWYHAFCVGFDPEGSCDNSWLCPGCTGNKGPQKADSGDHLLDGDSTFLNTLQHDSELDGDHVLPASISTGTSVSVAVERETAVFDLLVDGQQENQESDELVFECTKDEESTLPCDSGSHALISDALEIDGNNSNSNLCQNEMDLSLSPDKCDAASLSLPPDRNIMASDPDLGLLEMDIMEENGTVVDTMPTLVEPYSTLEVLSPAQNMVFDVKEAFSPEPLVHHDEMEIFNTTGGKRKLITSRDMDEEESNITNKKFKGDQNEGHEVVLGDSNSILSHKDDENFNIMDIVKEADKRSHKQQQFENSSSINERESGSGFRLKKIMRVAGDEKDSSLQELRDKIREAVRNKSSGELEKDLFEPKLLDAFRSALAGSSTENRKPNVDIKAKRSFLQKGKVRESLTKKIYGTGGKRRRAWTRDCDIEFWKHRCAQGSRPEKMETLKTVLDMLRGDSNSIKLTPEKQEVEMPSLLGRLYLADTSVFPRKNDAVPLSAFGADKTTEQERAVGSIRKLSAPGLTKCIDANSQQCVSVSPSISGTELSSVKDMNSGTPGDAQKKINPNRSNSTASLEKKKSTEKEKIVKSENRGDKRKWAMEVLARKTVVLGNTAKEKNDDDVILKGDFSLLAKLPKDMRPVLASTRHNKIPIPVRQAQLYRLTEHFLKKLKVPISCRTGETELAVADAVNIEKQVADKSNSKIVYLNLCSQELLRRSDDPHSSRVQELNPCSTSGCPTNKDTNETDHCSSGSQIDEALKKAGLMPDSPPNSPETDHLNTKLVDAEIPDNVIEVAPHSEFENDNSIVKDTERFKVPGVSDPNLPVNEGEVAAVPSPQSKQVNPKEVQNVDCIKDQPHLLPSSPGSKCEELQPQNVNFPETTPAPPSENIADCKNNKISAKKHSKGSSTTTTSVVKTVEAYIKEHLRPFCKSGVISVDDYRWAVGKTTEKVMKFHCNDENASFLIREGEKVKKLAGQYLEASQALHNSKSSDK